MSLPLLRAALLTATFVGTTVTIGGGTVSSQTNPDDHQNSVLPESLTMRIREIVKFAEDTISVHRDLYSLLADRTIPSKLLMDADALRSATGIRQHYHVSASWVVLPENGKVTGIYGLSVIRKIARDDPIPYYLAENVLLQSPVWLYESTTIDTRRYTPQQDWVGVLCVYSEQSIRLLAKKLHLELLDHAIHHASDRLTAVERILANLTLQRNSFAEGSEDVVFDRMVSVAEEDLNRYTQELHNLRRTTRAILQLKSRIENQTS